MARITAVPAKLLEACRTSCMLVVASAIGVVGSTGYNQRVSYPSPTPSRLVGFTSSTVVPT